MNRVFLVIITATVVSCVNKNSPNIAPVEIKSEFNVESALIAIEIAEKISNGEQVSDSDWDKLFKSKGYSNFLIYDDSLAKKELIKSALITVFDKDQQEILDSIKNVPMTMDKNLMALLYYQNFIDLKTRLTTAKDFLENTDFSALIMSGDSLAKQYLPASIKDSLPELYDVFLILSDPDGKVMNEAIVLDLNVAAEYGKDYLIKIIAHEYHHVYRKLTTPDYNHPLLVQLNKIHQEGLADLIDKDEPPLDEFGLYPQVMIDAYNADYHNTPNTLQKLDSLTLKFLNSEMDSTSYFNQLKYYFRFGGHTTGIYMSFNIAEDIGVEPLIESYNDPVKFIRLYNEYAEMSKTDHVFSDSFIEYIENLN